MYDKSRSECFGFFLSRLGKPGHLMPNDSAERTNLSSQSGDRFSLKGDGAYQEDQTESLLYHKR